MKYRDLENKKRYSRQHVIPSLKENGFFACVTYPTEKRKI